MNDTFAAAVQLVVCFLGLAASLWIGWLQRGPRSLGKIAFSAGLAMAVGVTFTFVAVYANGMCRDYWHRCAEHGDGNMGYWFLPFFATPLYWLLVLAFGSREDPMVFTPSPFDQVVDAALGQFHRNEAMHQRCPSCKSILSLEHVKPAAATQRQIRLRCACSKCDRLFDIHPEVP